jgi:type 1 glutamine amidotransferase
VNKILLITDGIFHPPILARTTLRKNLNQLNQFAFHHIRSMEKLPNDLQTYSAAVIYLHHKKISHNALNQLDAFVAAGGGLLAIHSATASFKQQSHYFNILGGRFVGHDKPGRLSIEHCQNDAIFPTIPSFSVQDELYRHELTANVTVHFTVKTKTADVPVVWTHQYEKGRVCYAVPGHQAQTLKNTTYQRLLQTALIWVAAL